MILSIKIVTLKIGVASFLNKIESELFVNLFKLRSKQNYVLTTKSIFT